MIKNCEGNFIEIWAYIKNSTKLGHSVKSIYEKIVYIYGDNIFLYRTVSFQMGKAIT